MAASPLFKTGFVTVRNVMTWNHGTNGLLIAFGISAFGVLLGLILGRATFQRTLLFPLTAIPIFFLAVLLWTVLARPLQGLGPASNLVPYLGLIFIGIFSGLAGKLLAKVPEKKNHKCGTILSKPGPGAVRSILNPKGLTLADEPVSEADDTNHFKMIGTTGTGKSTAIRELLTGALARGDRAVIADPDGSYLNRYYDPHRGDQILNAFDSRAARWDLVGEMTTMHDADGWATDEAVLTVTATSPCNQRCGWQRYCRYFLRLHGSTIRSGMRLAPPADRSWRATRPERPETGIQAPKGAQPAMLHRGGRPTSRYPARHLNSRPERAAFQSGRLPQKGQPRR